MLYYHSFESQDVALVHHHLESVMKLLHSLLYFLVSFCAFLAFGNELENQFSDCESNQVVLNIMTDKYGGETSWILKNDHSEVLYSGYDYTGSEFYQTKMCLDDGEYQFTITDSYGDGMCCDSGYGSYFLLSESARLASGRKFKANQTTHFALEGKASPSTLDQYYQSTNDKTGYELKTELFQIIRHHQSRGYSAIWALINNADKDRYYEKDHSVLDMYTESPLERDSVIYQSRVDQCGQYRKEGDCYNREHAFPKSWFGGKVEPMNSDAHHIFASDGYVNGKRSNWPFGEVSESVFVSRNGSKLGFSSRASNYNGKVFEPIDEFKGDFARAYFYMATRYQDVIHRWEKNSMTSDAVLDGSKDRVFEPWMLVTLIRWHKNDPVSLKERERNQAVYLFQGNRNPYVDHPEFVEQIWSK